MCNLCEIKYLGRRAFLTSSAAGLVAGVLTAPGALAAGGPTTLVKPDEALAKLMAGNAKYVAARQVCAPDLDKQRVQVANSQTPWATILTCADSRVPPELLFGGAGPGDLFVARNAGNMADAQTMGTIEYGAAVLGVPLIMVLGHERCGAVAAACYAVEKKAKFPGSIGPMVQAIVPAAQSAKGKSGDFVDNAVRESAKRTAAKIGKTSAIIARLIEAGKVKIVAARYDLDSGKVELL